ncbi:MAG: hypothetical protein IJ779_04340 [Ruminococcus sp.]|nr:hypothetical protein [Ruminococcus sp.]
MAEDVKKLLHRAVDELTDEQARALLAVLHIGLTERYPCPCCGNLTLIGSSQEDTAWQVCEVCFWENDVSPDKPENISGSNGISLELARLNYKKFGACREEFIDSARPPENYEKP